jgi:hypothetical protein
VSGGDRDFVVFVREQARAALAERLSLLADVGLRKVVSPSSPGVALHELRRISPAWGVYALDLDSVTSPVIGACVARRIPVVLDLGDDAYALARAEGRGRFSAFPRLVIDFGARRTVPALVYRGRMHPILRRLPRTSSWCPDTVPDWVIDADLPPGDRDSIATFGTIGAPDSSGWTYGREIVDALEADRGLRGTIVGRGPGTAFFRQLARDRGLEHRLAVLDAMPLEDLVQTMAASRFITSYQSNDRAGWVRTTGKLPLVLGSGRVLLSTDVGEAAFALPQPWRLCAESRDDFGPAVADRVRQLGDVDASTSARALAETYRRSTVASRLGGFLDQLQRRDG